MIRKLYNNMVQDMDLPEGGSRRLKEEILLLLREEEVRLDKKEYERYRDKAFLVASAAEEHGFEIGFRYAFQLMAECIREPF